MDLVLMGGNVLTMNQRQPRAEAVAVQGDKIAAVGANAEIAPYIGPDTTVVHLIGRTLIPGFIDAHNHFSLTTFEPVSVDCRVPPHGHIGSILAAIAAAARQVPRGRWLRGWGFRTWLVREERAVTRWELDEAAPEHPVCLMDTSCHACYVNSAALALAGIDRQTPDPPHGWILRDDQGEPNGTLWEGAMNLVHDLSLQAYIESYKDDLADLVVCYRDSFHPTSWVDFPLEGRGSCPRNISCSGVPISAVNSMPSSRRGMHRPARFAGRIRCSWPMRSSQPPPSLPCCIPRPRR
jgi:predicted amidohydrolase YtcJ